jgi:hypothetical protein
MPSSFIESFIGTDPGADPQHPATNDDVRLFADHCDVVAPGYQHADPLRIVMIIA